LITQRVLDSEQFLVEATDLTLSADEVDLRNPLPFFAIRSKVSFRPSPGLPQGSNYPRGVAQGYLIGHFGTGSCEEIAFGIN